jgi:REP element-mobilizing transposase RayT
MARRPRDDAPGVAHHLMLRGIERRTIFLDDADREDFLRRLSQLIGELGFLCFAWVLMPNHVHLVVRSGEARISRLMARLGTGYARRFNERYDRVGHLFQNRFRSRRVVDDIDLMGLVLYVSRNPLEAGLVADRAAAERFAWSSLAALMGHRAARPFEAVAETLGLFDADPERARRALRRRLGAVASADDAPPRLVSRRAEADRAPLGGFDELLHAVSAAHALEPGDLCSRRRTPRIAAARAELAWRAASDLGLSGSEIARRLGLTSAAVSLMLVRRRNSEPTS